MAESTGRITLWGIEVFVAAAEESSITAAARRLRASPSAVSQQLTNLEAALDMAQELSNCQFQLDTGPSHRLMDKLDQRALDMIVGADLGEMTDWMEVHPILVEPFVAIVPKGSVASGKPMDTLRRMPLILYSVRHHMGRLISAHLARQNLTLNYRFELDSYPAIMAMVASGAGWTILTPLALLHARLFRDKADVIALPFPPLSRTISLTARKGVLEDMPARTAARLRPLVQEMVVTPTVTHMPWLRESLRVLPS